MSSNVEQPASELDAVGPAGVTAPDATAREAIPNTSQERPEGVRDTSPPAPPRPSPPAVRPQSSTAPGQTNPRPAQPGGQTSNPANSTTTPGAGGAGPTGGSAVNPRAATNPNAGANNPGAGSGATTVPAPTAPAAPADSDPNAPPAIGPPGEVRREAYRPSNYAARSVRSESRNVLIGTVLSRTAGEPEEGVRIEVMNETTGGAKTSTTDAFGRFAIRLADGDWSVNVSMPSGRVYEVSQIRVGGGQIIDSQGRRVPSLEITR